MPWKEICAMDEKVRFIGDWLRDEHTISDLCRAYGISRKTGYKIIARYDAVGLDGLRDDSRRPKVSPRALPEAMVELIVATRQAHPRWGPRKIRGCIQREHPGLKVPWASTIGEVLKRFGLVKPRKRRQRVSPYTAPFSECTEPNQLWCADFKGWFRAADGNRCEPLTISDAFSRFLIRCQIVPNTRIESVRPIFEAAFREFGLPKTIRTDNGPPFASVAERSDDLVDTPRYRPRADRSWPSRAERAARAHAPDAQAGNDAATAADGGRSAARLR